MKFNKSKVLAVDIEHRQDAGPRLTYTFKCLKEDCISEIRVRTDSLKTSSGFCKVHVNQKRPYESIYQGLVRNRRKIPVHITYSDFLNFTKIKKCHYCGVGIPWVPFGTVKGVYKTRAYFLDRKSHREDYSVQNCIVCCTRCNRLRSDKFTYEEFKMIGRVIKRIERIRLEVPTTEREN